MFKPWIDSSGPFNVLKKTKTTQQKKEKRKNGRLSPSRKHSEVTVAPIFIFIFREHLPSLPYRGLKEHRFIPGRADTVP